MSYNIDDIRVFSSNDFGDLRVLEIDGAPWFIYDDVCKCIGIENNKTYIDNIDKNSKREITLIDLNGNSNTITVIDFRAVEILDDLFASLKVKENESVDASNVLMFVYVLINEKKLVKIGITKNVKQRVKAVTSSSGIEIVECYYTDGCYNAREIERKAHEYFKDYRLKGEWFDIDYSKAVEKVKELFNEFANIENPKLTDNGLAYELINTIKISAQENWDKYFVLYKLLMNTIVLYDKLVACYEDELVYQRDYIEKLLNDMGEKHEAIR